LKVQAAASPQLGSQLAWMQLTVHRLCGWQVGVQSPPRQFMVQEASAWQSSAQPSPAQFNVQKLPGPQLRSHWLPAQLAVQNVSAPHSMSQSSPTQLRVQYSSDPQSQGDPGSHVTTTPSGSSAWLSATSSLQPAATNAAASAGRRVDAVDAAVAARGAARLTVALQAVEGAGRGVAS